MKNLANIALVLVVFPACMFAVGFQIGGHVRGNAIYAAQEQSAIDLIRRDAKTYAARIRSDIALDESRREEIASLKADLAFYEKQRQTPDAEAWLRLCHAELNVRYRDKTGDDGLRGEWVALRDKALKVYWLDRAPQDAVDALLVEQVAITAKESPDVDVDALHAIQDEMDKEIEAGTFPPKQPENKS